MLSYRVIYRHSSTDEGGHLMFKAEDDADLRRKVSEFVGDGYRGQTRAAVTLASGQRWICHNEGGRAVWSHDWAATPDIDGPVTVA